MAMFDPNLTVTQNGQYSANELHDAICLWLYKEFESGDGLNLTKNMVTDENFYGGDESYREVDRVFIELPLYYQRNGKPSGFVDVAVRINFRLVREGTPKHITITKMIFFEVKSYVKSVGEVLRQVKSYKSMLPEDQMSPDSICVVFPKGQHSKILTTEQISKSLGNEGIHTLLLGDEDMKELKGEK